MNEFQLCDILVYLYLKIKTMRHSPLSQTVRVEESLRSPKFQKIKKKLMYEYLTNLIISKDQIYSSYPSRIILLKGF